MGVGIFFIIPLIIVFSVLGIILAVQFARSRIPEDSTILIHYMPQYTKGHVEGLITKTIRGKDRTAIFFQSRDNNYLSSFIKKIKFKSENFMLIARNDLIEHLPRGSFSDHRNYMKVYPCKAERIPEGLKLTAEGKIMMQVIENKSEEKLQVQVLREIMNRKDAILKENAGREITPEFMETLSKNVKAGMEATVKNLTRDKSPGSSDFLNKSGGS